jgi:hypothetical protein
MQASKHHKHSHSQLALLLARPQRLGGHLLYAFCQHKVVAAQGIHLLLQPRDAPALALARPAGRQAGCGWRHTQLEGRQAGRRAGGRAGRQAQTG